VPNPAAVTTYDDYIPVREIPSHPYKSEKKGIGKPPGGCLDYEELHLIPLTSDFSLLEHVDTSIFTKLPNRSLFTRCSVFTSIVGSTITLNCFIFLTFERTTGSRGTC
jgi:hypothetical protein